MPDSSQYDFGGWATRNDIKCADGRTIRKNAFADCDGEVVPLIWYHDHDNPASVVGHALLCNEDEGVYTFGSFNNTEMGKIARECVQHGDITHLSIYANKLKQNGGDVLHGVIREVSLVMAGANPGARIDVPILEHGEDGSYEEADEANIFTDYPIELMHAEDENMDYENDYEYEDENGYEDEGYENAEDVYADIFDNMTEEQQEAVYYLVGQASGSDNYDEEFEHAENMEGDIGAIFDSMTEEQQEAVYYLVGKAATGYNDEDEDEDEDDEGETEMKHNLFDYDEPAYTLTHADMAGIIEDARRIGSLKQAVEESMENGVLRHALYNDDGTEASYGVSNIGTLFPDYRSLNTPPEMIKRNTDWVNVVMNGVHHTPFSRIKSMFANITMDEARAKGYIKGNRKKEEVFSLLKRTTDPQTVYKKQKLDRDDQIDITDFDVVAWLKGEMRTMLDEELARAMLIGDGRLATDEDHISWDHIRPVATDDELYTIKVHVKAATDSAQTAKNIISTFLRNRKNYKGSGNITFFTTEDWLCEMLLLEDGFGHSLYADEAALARKLRVQRIVTVPVMEGQKIDNQDLIAIALDLHDYNVGADKGGAVNMFDDFDIDFNQMKYLIETRCSGALTKPFSAFCVVLGGTATTYTEAEVTGSSTPKASGWYVKEGDIYILTKDVAPVIVGKDTEGADVYKTYYVKG